MVTGVCALLINHCAAVCSVCTRERDAYLCRLALLFDK